MFQENLCLWSESYALKVEGDSMINEGIYDGDTVLIRKTNLAENGDIVVALVDDHEATLKRLRKKDKVLPLKVLIHYMKQEFWLHIE